MKKRYKVLRTFGLAGQGFFVEGTEVEVEVVETRPAGWKGPVMSFQREGELLAEERIELVSKKEVKRGQV